MQIDTAGRLLSPLGIKRGILIAAVVAAVLFAGFLLVRPVAIRGRFPERFSEIEKREIASATVWDAYHRSLRCLAHGQVKQAWRWIRNARRQEVYAIGNQPAGEIWIHVGVKDPSQSDGYDLTARYIMKKEKEHWRIVTLF